MGWRRRRSKRGHGGEAELARDTTGTQVMPGESLPAWALRLPSTRELLAARQSRGESSPAEAALLPRIDPAEQARPQDSTVPLIDPPYGVGDDLGPSPRATVPPSLGRAPEADSPAATPSILEADSTLGELAEAPRDELDPQLRDTSATAFEPADDLGQGPVPADEMGRDYDPDSAGGGAAERYGSTVMNNDPVVEPDMEPGDSALHDPAARRSDRDPSSDEELAPQERWDDPWVFLPQQTGPGEPATAPSNGDQHMSNGSRPAPAPAAATDPDLIPSPAQRSEPLPAPDPADRADEAHGPVIFGHGAGATTISMSRQQRPPLPDPDAVGAVEAADENARMADHRAATAGSSPVR